MIIRNSQLDTLGSSLRAAFDASVADTFRDVWPDRVESLGEQYLDFIHRAVDRAYSHDLADDADAARFVNLTLLWGLGFEDSPAHFWAREILSDPDLPGGIKIQNLFERSELELAADGTQEARILNGQSFPYVLGADRES
jgi:hypothetical protein